jgi:tetratricopeptide (TPR) repeat protein
LSYGWRPRNSPEYDKAIADYNQAVSLDPNDARAYASLAWLQATCPDARYRNGKKAFENANKAYQLDGGKDPNDIDDLAAAYAECGDFDAAKEWQDKAIALCTDEKLKQILRYHLESYKQNKQWRAKPDDAWH